MGPGWWQANDGRWYPPAGSPLVMPSGPPPAPGPPRSFRPRQPGPPWAGPPPPSTPPPPLRARQSPFSRPAASPAEERRTLALLVGAVLGVVAVFVVGCNLVGDAVDDGLERQMEEVGR